MLRVYTMSSGKFTVNVVLPKRAVNGATSYTKLPTDKDMHPIWASPVTTIVRHLVLGQRKSPVHTPHSVNQYLVNQFNDAVLQLDDHKGFKNLELFQISKLTIVKLRRASLREHIQFLVLPFFDNVETQPQAGRRSQALVVPVQSAP